MEVAFGVLKRLQASDKHWEVLLFLLALSLCLSFVVCALDQCSSSEPNICLLLVIVRSSQIYACGTSSEA